MRKVGRICLGVAAAAFTYLAYIYLTLPDVRVLRDQNPATTAFMDLRAAEAAELERSWKPRHHWISYERMSGQLKRAVLVAEDSAFWDHEGIDLEEIQKSMEINWASGRIARGGSTITQQLAKNLYLSPSRNPIRKLRELLIARRLEVELSKRRILELYLNVIEWGDGVFGAEAAARTYFNKTAAGLGADESALLAAAIVNPRVYRPSDPSPYLRRRQRLILRRMGAVTPPPSLTVEAVPAGAGVPQELTAPAAAPEPQPIPFPLPGRPVPPERPPG